MRSLESRKPGFIRHETNLLKQVDWKGRPQLDSQIGKMFRRTEDGLVIFQSGYVRRTWSTSPGCGPSGNLSRQAASPSDPKRQAGHAADLRRRHDRQPPRTAPCRLLRRAAGRVDDDRVYRSLGRRTAAPFCRNATARAIHGKTRTPTRTRYRNRRHHDRRAARSLGRRRVGQQLLGDLDPADRHGEDAAAIIRRLLPRHFAGPCSRPSADSYVELFRVSAAAGRAFIRGLVARQLEGDSVFARIPVPRRTGAGRDQPARASHHACRTFCGARCRTRS